jgi:hypothetical protein
MLPKHDPNQIMPATIIFFDWPPVLLVIRERPMIKEAWYEPVR